MEHLYILEVQEFIPEPLQDKGFLHVGYMNRIFTSKIEAIEYYDKYNIHMRSINRYANLCSDWDPNTNLRYIVRRYYGERKTMTSFENQ
jgi:hypothetical protein